MSKSSFYKTTATPDEMVAVATSATNAATSASEAATSASQASTSAASALSHKNDAQTAKTASETARDASVVAKNASETAKTASEAARDTASSHATTATTKANEATASAQLADDYAVKVNGVVTGSDYSSKAHAVGGTGIDNGVGSAKDWAIKTSGTVGNTSEYSAKHYATTGNVVAVANALTNINAVAGQISPTNNLATVAGDTTDIGTLAGLSTQLGLLGTSDAVSDMNALANITSDISALAGALEQTYTVTVGGGVFVLGGSNNPTIEMFRGSSYTFNQNDATNDGHPLVFKNGSSAYQDGVTYYLNGAVTSYANYINTTTFNAGRSSGDRKVVIEVQSTAPSSGLRYYCYIHGNGMGNTITVKDSNISLVATNIANVNNTGGAIANVNAVAGNATNINAVANNETNINTVAGDATEINAVAGNSTNINAVAGNATNINAVAGNSTNINAVNSNSTNINAVAGNATNINTVAGANTNIGTVATNISSINDFADKYRIGSSDPSSSNDEGDLFYNTTSNTLKVYTGSAWEAGVTAGSGFAALSGANFTGDIDINAKLTVDQDTSNQMVASFEGIDGRVHIGRYGHILQQNTTDSTTNFWGTATRNGGSLDIAYGTATSDGVVSTSNNIISIAKTGNTTFSGNVDVTGTLGSTGNFDVNTNKFVVNATNGNTAIAGTVDVDANLKANSLSIDHASNDWNFELDGADLIIKNGSTTLFKLDTSGNLTVAGDITTDGSL